VLHRTPDFPETKLQRTAERLMLKFVDPSIAEVVLHRLHISQHLCLGLVEQQERCPFSNNFLVSGITW
jgi:hypothetical protein